MSAVSKEVGNKIFPATEMDDPLFYYSYGYSFIMLKVRIKKPQREKLKFSG